MPDSGQLFCLKPECRVIAFEKRVKDTCPGCGEPGSTVTATPKDVARLVYRTK